MILRTDPDVCPEPVFSRTKLFSTDPHEVCKWLLPQISVKLKRAMKQIVCRPRSEGPHLVYRPSLQGG